MNVRERLKEAHENVAFNADKTWTSSPNAYQKRNMELYLTERHVQINQLHRNRPRTVREGIPKSKLARYSNYVYNESREMSYASSHGSCEGNVAERMPTEPWEMPEVGELYRWFLKNQLEDDFSRLGQYQSPLLSVNGFEDKILKIQLTEDRVKKIWKRDHNFDPNVRHLLVNIFTSPLANIFLFAENENNYDWFRDISITKDFEQLKKLSKTFKDETASLFKEITGEVEPPPPAEPVSTEILYSEVLQGLSPSRRLLSSHKPDHGKPEESTNQDNFTNYTILTPKQEDPPPKLDSFPSKVSQLPPSNKLLPQKTPPTNVYFQTDTQRCKPPTTQPQPMETFQSRTVHPSCVQQTFFYPVQAVQRWIPSSFSSYYPTQIFAANWLTQNPIVSNVSRIFGPALATERDSDGFGQGFNEEIEVQYVEEHPVTATVSEELEIQALEQYSNSNENLYQELERQAAEQYATSPE